MATTQRRMPGLQLFLDLGALLLRDRAVVGLRENGSGARGRPGLRHHPAAGVAVDRGAARAQPLGVDLVEARGQALTEAPRVDEHDGRAVLHDAVDDRLFDVRPQRPGHLGRLGHRSGAERRTSPRRRRRATVRSAQPVPRASAPGGGGGLSMSSTGTTTRRSKAFEDFGATISTGAAPPRNRATSSIGPHGRRQADALRGSRARLQRLAQGVESLEAHREVGAALGGRDGVHLVDDDRVHARERLPGLAREHQVERLGRRDQDVGRRGDELAPVARGRVARAHADRHLGERDPEAPGGLADPHERGAEVALDIDAQRLERRDVEDAGAVSRRHLVSPSWSRRASSGRRPPAKGSWKTRSIAQRKADSVLPEPVGATTSACLPAEMASHAPICAVGRARRTRRGTSPASQDRTARARAARSSTNRRPSSYLHPRRRHRGGWRRHARSSGMRTQRIR